MPQPMQPIYKDEHGTIRFQPNQIIDWLFKSGRLNLNELSTMGFGNDDWMQLAQLLGYSVSGFGTLSYADPKVVEQADAIADRLL